MNREIKFRAWDGKFMHYEADIVNGKHFIDGFNLESVLMQFTGLHDKNGREIYEGDICQRLSSNGTKNQMAIGIISFYKGSFCFHRVNASIIMAADNLVYHYSDCEIIGNIYENNELLKS